MRADLRALLEDADGELALALGGELAQPDRGGEAGRPGADDHHVELHAFACHDSQLTSGRIGRRTCLR